MSLDLSETTAPPASLESSLELLRELLDRDAVEAARDLLADMSRRWPDAERVRHLAQALSPPVARARPELRRQLHERERAWLREHAAAYPGCWLAIAGDRLLVADPSLGNVLAQVRALPDGKDALLHYQPGTEP